MKKSIIALAGIACLLANTNDASAYVKGSKPKSAVSTSSVSSSMPGRFYVSGGLLYAPTVKLKFEDESNNFESGLGLRLAGGMSFDKIRLEGEFKYIDGAEHTETYTEFDGFDWDTYRIKGENSQMAFMANGYYDIDLNSGFALFVTGGVGFAHNTFTVKDDSLFSREESDWVFAYQIGGGLSYWVNQNMSVDFGYRFGGTSEAEYSVWKYNVYSHELSAGLKYRF